ncbi:MAG: type II secretion system F family protein [Elusimicrobiota bacterium]
MILISKIVIILAVGCLTGLVVLKVIEGISRTFQKLFIDKKKKSAKTTERTEHLKVALKTLAENPASAASRYIKLAAAVFVLIFAQLTMGKIIFAFLFAIGTFIYIGKHFKKQIKKKMDLFENQLIEALGMITNSVRAGQSLLQALENMVKDTKPPISSEFGEALRQIKLGTPINQALLDIIKRVKSKDLRIAVTSINLARETGGNLGEILSRLASTMRERKKIQGKIEAMTAQGKTSGAIMAGVPFLMLGILYFLEPEMMGLLFSEPIGNALLFIAVVMVSLGTFFINKIVSIDI